MTPRHFNRAEWRADGFGLMLVVGRGRAFDYLAWYHAVMAAEVVPTIPDREKLVGDIRWAAPPAYGTCSPAQFRKMELAEVGVFPVDPARLDYFFPHLAPGTAYAINDISVANNMEIRRQEAHPRWRRPDGKLELIVYPSAPTLAELM
jgi:hypothetical protein